MSIPPPPPPIDARDEDPERAAAWILALQGSDAQDPMDRTIARSGRLLRTLMLQAQQADAPSDAAYTQALLDRWARLGLLDGQQHRGAARWWHSLSARLPGARGWLAACTAMLVAALGLRVWLNDAPADTQDDAAINRGDEQAVQIWADDPTALAARIETVLQERRIPTRRVELGDRSIQLQARLPQGDAQLQQELLALGVSAPAHGRLNLVITRPR